MLLNKIALLLPLLYCAYSTNNNCTYKTADNVCFGHDLKEKAFLLGSGFTNLNHGSFGTGN